jgi:hypothetical protein
MCGHFAPGLAGAGLLGHLDSVLFAIAKLEIMRALPVLLNHPDVDAPRTQKIPGLPDVRSIENPGACVRRLFGRPKDEHRRILLRISKCDGTGSFAPVHLGQRDFLQAKLFDVLSCGTRKVADADVDGIGNGKQRHGWI